MKRVLLIAYDYPPCRAPGAGLRSQKFARYLPGFGWQPTVLCREENASVATAGVIRVASPSLPGAYQLTAYAWALQAYRRALGLLRAERFDLVYASCPPFGISLAALRLKRRLRIPVVVDFRDAWSLDPYATGGAAKRLLKRALCRYVFPRAERRIAARADLWIANTPSMQRAHALAFGVPEEQIALLPNGFDEADFQAAGPGQPSAPPAADPASDRCLEILYCGRFGAVAGRSPEALLQALRAVVASGRRVRLRVLGDDTPALRRLVLRHGLESAVSLSPTISHPDAVRAMQAADVLALYQEPGRPPVSAVAGKTYEYLRCGRPILALLPPGDNLDLVRRYSAEAEIVTTFAAPDVEQALIRLYERWRRGLPPQTPHPEFVARHNRENLTRELAGWFDRIAASAAVGRASCPIP